MKLLSIILLLVCSYSTTAQRNRYWAMKKYTGLEWYTYLVEAWPRDQRCSTYATRRPVKLAIMRRYKSAKRKPH
jgi:hypothetical protein